MQAAVLDQTWLEMNEPLLRLDFKCCRVAIAANRHRMNIPSPIQVGADYQCSRFGWITDAERPLEIILLGLRHFPDQS